MSLPTLAHTLSLSTITLSVGIGSLSKPLHTYLVSPCSHSSPLAHIGEDLVMRSLVSSCQSAGLNMALTSVVSIWHSDMMTSAVSMAFSVVSVALKHV